ncbi:MULTISPECIES: DUF4089 domain-containing protein [Trichocoleus]|uniref:DUF4089 domain-containing protein n=1 Tax=Trichocoleus desertorum GB2-A4 TaxID=2933944 RepID=A0ABV0J241_9CYAN|nr:MULTISPECIES: DUF4089 domain-containing protein [unclassified Trichocoleus]MBD1860461.1 DUF4089 domain-containing protein [Trichocoleus sp. FACHB-46]MBD2097522.1 DUF4089 domain-containing protein [Trichocoleus sp. FACHB-591]
MSNATIDPTDYVHAAASLIDLPLDPEGVPSVVTNFARIQAIAELVLEFPLPDQIEAAPIFVP